MSAWDEVQKWLRCASASPKLWTSIQAARAEDAERSRQAEADAFIAGFSAGMCSTRGPLADYQTWQQSKRES